MNGELVKALERVARRVRQVRLWTGLGLCWAAWALVGLALTSGSWIDQIASEAGTLLAAALGAMSLSIAACALWSWRSARDSRALARRIEARHPELGTGLLAAVEQSAGNAGRLGYLQSTVVREALVHDRLHNWDRTVPTWLLRTTKVLHATALASLIVVTFGLVGQARSRPSVGSEASASADSAGVSVEPGDAEIERGTPLLVVARFRRAVPADADLVVTAEGGAESRQAMTRSLEDPAFAARLNSVESDLAYRVNFAGESSRTYRVTVFEYPAVERVDAQLEFPAYTSLATKRIDDVRHVTAVEGTRLTLLYRLNKTVKAARLVGDDGTVVELTPSNDAEHARQASVTLAETRRLKVELIDERGRKNKTPHEIGLQVVRNKPATVRVTQPARDMRVSPLEELNLNARIEDDFGVTRHGVTYSLAGSQPREIVLNEGAATKQAQAAHVLDFESFAAEPDQLVTYHFWAEDVGPDGQPRRTSGDMFFAEVRPFEEIFRQGEQPAGGQQQGQQGGNAQQAMQLAELQKEIINATWSLIRRETGKTPSAEFKADAKLLRDSQRSAIEQAASLGERLQEPSSQAELTKAVEFMQQAEEQLESAIDAKSASTLEGAIGAEQAAYQSLLKLRDREFNVVQGQQQGGGGGGGGGPSQQQLRQLELSNEENRYEQRRSAQSEEADDQRETRQILNRLRELARRQEDINERLKELQAALQAAEDQHAREEIERQLKRLREQQQQMLRDTDELQERMEREENRERMADAREQVEQTREHVRQASEALEEGRLSQALTEGTRAGRQLDELREDVRRDASNRFSEEMTQMREEARRLDETQRSLTQQLQKMEQAERRALRDSGERQQMQTELERQREGIGELLERMRETVQEAEETEPLLAEKLFQAAQQADQKSLDDALHAAEQLTELGVPAEAAKASQHASDRLTQLREGVEEAAESVLGDETEALRRAQSELEDLADDLDREIRESNSGEAAQSSDFSQDVTSPGEATDPRPEGQDEGTAAPPEDENMDSGRAGEEGQQRGPKSDRGSAQRPRERNGTEREQERSGEPVGREQRGEQPGGQQQDGQRQDDRQQGGQPQGGQPLSDQQQSGQQPGGQRQSRQQPGGQQQGGADASPRTPAGGSRGGAPGSSSALRQLLEQVGGPGGNPGGPITGDGFREWSDRLRDVEELLEDPDLRAETARIRDRARGAREEFKRHAKEPDWTKLDDLVAEPIRELSRRIGEEVRRRESPDSLVPIDRDPVPPDFIEDVREYYERLGTGR